MLQPKPLKHTITEYSEETGLGNCAICGPNVETYLYSKNRTTRGCLEARRKSRRESMKKKYHEDPAAARNKRYLLLFGISYDQMMEMLSEQGGVCAICSTDYPGAKGWALDHDYKCCPVTPSYRKTCGKCIRAVLCNNCNTGLGLFKDDPGNLQAAIDYLAKHS